MKTTFYVLFAVGGLLMYNMFLIERDQKMFEAYDTSHERLMYPTSKIIK